MSTKAITEKHESVTERPVPSSLPGAPLESAPSLLLEDQPTLPRTLGMLGGGLVIFGGMALTFNLIGRSPPVSTGFALLLLCVGLCGLLFHAAFDKDIQFRRMYMVFGLVTLGLGAVLTLLPYPKAVGDQFHWGVSCLVLGLFFLLAFLRTETEPFLRDLIQKVLGLAGLVMAVAGFLGGNIRAEFFLPMGLVFATLGLVFMAAFVASRGISDDLAYYAALGLGLVGLAVMVVALGRTLFLASGSKYFTSTGAILLTLGGMYAFTGAGLASDRPFWVLTRRELGAFFFSPVAYLTLFGFVVLSWIAYFGFIDNLLESSGFRDPPTEPIVRNYFFALFPVFTAVVVVPVLTMRLFSEEHRSGTLEVLLTAPVEEVTLVMSKFVAALLTYLLMWAPFGLYLIAIPLAGGAPFDYRPLLSFALVLAVTGAAFIAGGVFFSSLTKSQIASGVLTGAFMMLLTFIYFPAHQVPEGSGWDVFLKHMSYLDLWYQSLDGIIMPKFLLFFLSMTVLFLFMTVKVLESRKWR